MTPLTDWIGRTTELECRIESWHARALHATLDCDDAPPTEGDALPPGWHWIYFLEAAPSRELGADGHPRRGGFLPPVPLSRRMWAGSRIEFVAPLALGERARKVSRIVGIEEKNGRSGRLCFVEVEHEFHGESGLAIRERQDIVYRDPPKGEAVAPPPQAPADATWSHEWTFDPPRLFRYSALTFNGHRIHYDRPYATNEEGYPGLVVHGPLLATTMLELVRRAMPRRRIGSFEFRGISPVFDGQSIRACGRGEGDDVELWIADAAGGLRSRGRLRFAG